MKKIRYTLLIGLSVLLFVSIGFFDASVCSASNRQKPTYPFAVKLQSGYVSTFESCKVPLVAGKINMSNSPTIGGAFSWFYNKNISLSLAITTGKYSMDLQDGDYSKIQLFRDDLNMGSIWMTPISLSAAYHFDYWEKVIPYASLSASYILFSGADPGWALDKISYENCIGGMFSLGADYNLTERLFLNAEAYLCLMDNTLINLDMSLTNKWVFETQMTPFHFGLTFGIGCRF